MIRFGIRFGILSDYLFRAILVRLGLALPALALIYVAFELIDQGSRLASRTGWIRTLQVTLLHIPLVTVQVLPAALMLSVVLALAALRRRGELEAMASFGLTPARICTPILAAGTLATVLALLAGELVVPRCERWGDRIAGGDRPSALTGLSSPPRWARGAGWFVHLGQRGGGRDLVALELDRQFRLVRRIDGQWHSDSRGRVASATLRYREPGASNGTAIVRKELSTLDLPSDLSHLVDLLEQPSPRAEALDLISLCRRLHQLEQAGQQRPAEQLVLHTKIAFPLVNLVVALLACPFGFGVRRRRAVTDLAWAALLILGLWVLLATGWILARSGLLGPAAGVWLPVGLMAAGGVVGLLRRKGP